MTRLVTALLGNAAEAEDVVQDAFAAIDQRLDVLDRPGAYLRKHPSSTALGRSCDAARCISDDSPFSLVRRRLT
ncbi:MAG: DNA-directed RNA polymerase specialized sigma24 family protein [Candidatus Poriferisodalaceae bacterium]|jgi:DNA-directed RNA polymerase specialized sigma24 family protein